MTVYWRVNRETLQTLVYLWVTSPECTSRARNFILKGSVNMAEDTRVWKAILSHKCMVFRT